MLADDESVSRISYAEQRKHCLPVDKEVALSARTYAPDVHQFRGTPVRSNGSVGTYIALVSLPCGSNRSLGACLVLVCLEVHAHLTPTLSPARVGKQILKVLLAHHFPWLGVAYGAL